MAKKETEKKHEIEKTPNETLLRHTSDMDMNKMLKFLGESRYKKDRLIEIATQFITTFNMTYRMGAEASAKGGAALLLLKKETPHGEWLKLLERMNTSDRAAQRHMRFARQLIDIDKLDTRMLEFGATKLNKMLAMSEADREDAVNDEELFATDKRMRMTKAQLIKKLDQKDQKIKNGREQLANVTEDRDNYKKKRNQPSTITSLMLEVVPILSKLEDEPQPTEQWLAENAAVFARLIWTKAQRIYNNLANLPDAKIIHKIPEDMEALEEEFGKAFREQDREDEARNSQDKEG